MLLPTLLLFAALLSAPSFSQPANAREDDALELGELGPHASVEREFSDRARHSFRLGLRSGQFLELYVQTMGFTAGVTLFGPGGARLCDADSENNRARAKLFFVANDPGLYRIVIENREKRPIQRKYQLIVEELRDARPQDLQRVQAQQMREQAQRRSATRTPTGLQQSLSLYEQALGLWRQSRDQRSEAETLTEAGLALLLMKQFDNALSYLDRARQLSRAANDKTAELDSTELTAVIYGERGKAEKAIPLLEETLAARRALHDLPGEASALNNLSFSYMRLGEPRIALKYQRQALPLIQEYGTIDDEVTVLNNLIATSIDLGEYPSVLQFVDVVMGLRPLMKPRSEAHLMTNIGAFFIVVGAYDSALHYLNQAFRLCETMGDHEQRAKILKHIGNIHYHRGHYAEALSYFQDALRVHETLESPQHQIIALQMIGRIYNVMRRPEQAFTYGNRSLQLARRIGDRQLELYALLIRANAEKATGNSAQALDDDTRALQLAKELGIRSHVIQALAAIAEIQKGAGKFAEARLSFEEALSAYDSSRAGFVNDFLKSEYFARSQAIYASYVDLLMEMHRREPLKGFNIEALAASERGRARGLLELLQQGHLDLREGVDSKLLSKLRQLQAELNRQAEAQARSAKNSEPDKAQKRIEEIEDLTRQYQQVEAQIREKDQRYAAVTQPPPFSLKDVQERLLDPDTLILEYQLGERHSFLWVLSSGSISSFELPGRAIIESQARRLHQLLLKQGGVSQIQNGRGWPTDSAVHYWKAAAVLSRTLLAPVGSLLGNKRLAIVPDGILQYVPFAALPPPQKGRVSSASGVTSTPLLVEHEVVNLPSISVLGALRTDRMKRSKRRGTVAVFADPIFSREDYRIRAAAKRDLPMTLSSRRVLQLARGMDDVSGWKASAEELPRLPFTRQEAEGAFARASPGSLKAVDFSANRKAVLNGDLQRYDILHFATHGFVNARHPELSGIVLSLFDESGASQDGFIRLHDIYNLKLSADLVILSACQSALGQEVRGEGLIGLTRGFMYAGASRVIATLWRVDDAATAELMNHFYSALFSQPQRSPAAALRAAQLALSQHGPWNAPFYWASFILQGQWGD